MKAKYLFTFLFIATISITANAAQVKTNFTYLDKSNFYCNLKDKKCPQGIQLVYDRENYKNFECYKNKKEFARKIHYKSITIKKDYDFNNDLMVDCIKQETISFLKQKTYSIIFNSKKRVGIYDYFLERPYQHIKEKIFTIKEEQADIYEINVLGSFGTIGQPDFELIDKRYVWYIDWDNFKLIPINDNAVSITKKF